MSGRLTALVLVLAIVSAAVGAGAAVLLRQTSDAPAASTVEAAVVADPDSDALADSSPAPVAASAEAASPADSPATEAPAANQSTAQPATAAQPAQPAPQPAEAVAQPEPPEPPEQVELSEPAQAAELPPAEREPPPEPDAANQTEDAPPSAVLAPDLVSQGEAVALTVESGAATAVAATLRGRSWSLSEAAPGLWWGVLAVPRDADSGAAEVVVDLYGDGGAWLRSLTLSLIVLSNPAPLEEIILGGTGPTLDPAEVERDRAVRFSEHTAVSGPPRWDGTWLLPVEGEVTGVFGSQRSYDGVLAEQWHHGHDIAAQHGDQIAAPAAGVVVWTGELILHGLGVIIDHGAGVYSGYWHMSLIAVEEGLAVAPGDWLGNIGTTGLSTGPHLHWEVIIQGVDVDPVQWIGDYQPPLPSLSLSAAADTLD